MRLRITLTMDVDELGWWEEFGQTGTIAALREDVKSYIRSHVENSAAAEILTDVQVVS